MDTEEVASRRDYKRLEVEIGILVQLHREERDQGRQSETQRSTLANLLLVVCGALLGLVSGLHFRHTAWLPAAFVVMLGLFGAAFSYKYFERFELHRKRAGFIRAEIDELLGEGHTWSIESLRREADSAHESEYPTFCRIRLHWMWVGLNLLIALLGVVSLLILK